MQTSRANESLISTDSALAGSSDNRVNVHLAFAATMVPPESFPPVLKPLILSLILVSADSAISVSVESIPVMFDEFDTMSAQRCSTRVNTSAGGIATAAGDLSVCQFSEGRWIYIRSQSPVSLS